MPALDNILYPAMQRPASEMGQSQSFAAQEARKALCSAKPGNDGLQVYVGAHALERFDMLPIGIVIDESPKKNAVPTAQVLEKMKRAYLVALIGRIRNSM
jgi:hypothetical protein